MTWRFRPGVWWVPLLLAAAPGLGYVPSHRDLLDFFAPIREATASALVGGSVPWLNFANGCGEAWFANPETAVLYPPAWLHLVLPPPWALAAEIALHLAWLSLGSGLLARSLGAGRFGRVVVEAAAWSIGPLVFTVGVLNNLETLAWGPWMVLAARRAGWRAVPLVALTTAMAWLGGEPQIWAMLVGLALVTARSRAATAAGVAAAVAVVAVQLVPFVFWVAEGDRGPQAADWAVRGAIAPADWLGLVVPKPPAGAERMVYVESLFLGAPLLVFGLLGALRHRWLLVAAGGLAVVATLPEIGADTVFLTVTGGLVRYPSRFAIIGLALLVPLMGRGAEDWLAGRGRRLSAFVAALAIVLCLVVGSPSAWLLAGVPAALMLAAVANPAWRGLRAVVAAAGVIAAVVAAWPLLGMAPVDRGASRSGVWPTIGDGERVYAPAPSIDAVKWLAGSLDARRVWPVGYLNLVDGLTLVRTDSPVANGRLIDHLRVTDQGPPKRWWLDVLAARWVVLPESSPIPVGMEDVSRRGGMRLLANLQAGREIMVAAEPPRVDRPPRDVGMVTELESTTNAVRASIVADHRASLWVSYAPVRGWRWWLDGVEVTLHQGPGIIQHLEVDPGPHVLEGRYRPPGIWPAGVLSGCALVLLLALLWRGRDELLPTPATLD